MPSSPGSCNTSSPAPTADISEQDNVELESSNNEQTEESPDQSESESNFTDCTSTPKPPPPNSQECLTHQLKRYHRPIQSMQA